MTIELLGLEHAIWHSIGVSEQRKYMAVMYLYFAFLMLSLISSIFFSYMIVHSIWACFFIGIIISFVIGSIVRFSLIIFRRSIFDRHVPQDESSNTNIQTEINKASEVNSTSGNTIPKLNILSVLTEKVKRSVKSIKFNWPKAYSKVPGLAGMIRFSILAIISFLVVFPLSCLFHNETISEVNREIANHYLEQYQESLQNEFSVSTFKLNSAISQIEKELVTYSSVYQTNGILKEKKIELSNLKHQLDLEKSNFNDIYLEKVTHYRDILEGKYFIASDFKSVIKLPFFILSFIAVFFLVFYSHYLLYRLKTGVDFMYSILSTNHYRNLIDDEYEHTTSDGYALLKSKYDYTDPAFKDNVYWLDPPYCTARRKVFQTRLSIERNELFNSITSKIDK